MEISIFIYREGGNILPKWLFFWRVKKEKKDK
jgi:hypothetical protein